MTMHSASDIAMREHRDAAAIRRAFALGYGVPVERVVTYFPATATEYVDPDALVVLMPQEDLPGDFPVRIDQALATKALAANARHAATVAAVELDTIILTGGEGYDAMIAHLPDGGEVELDLPELEEGGFAMTPEFQAAIEAPHAVTV